MANDGQDAPLRQGSESVSQLMLIEPIWKRLEDAFGADIDYAQLQKIYGAANDKETRYSPALHRLRDEGCERKPGSKARQHIVCRAPKSLDANEHSTVYAAHQRIP
jgi:hypothetical protein